MSLYSERVAQDSPVLYFENNASGVNNTGSRTPTITTGSLNTFNSTGGVSNSAYMYVGSTSGSAYGFEYSDSTATFDDKAFSITGWFNLGANDATNQFNYLFHTGTAANGINVDTSSSGIYISATPNGFVNVVSSGLLTLDTWHHFAWTVDSTNMKLYIDGSLVDTQSTPSTISMDSQVKYWMRQTTSGTTRYGVKGKFDEWAVFNTTLSSTTISEHNNAGFGILVNATPVTASALAVEPTVSTTSVLTATVLTASAASGDHYASTRDGYTLLDGYMSTLTLEQWYKFDQAKAINNYGTGGASAYSFTGDSVNNITNGIQGQGALRITGGNTGAVYAVGTNTFSTEFTDDNFSLGFWVKKSTTESARIYAASTTGSENFTIQFESAGYITAVANLQNQTRNITTNTSYTDGNWHYVAVTLSGGTMTLYVDNVSKGTVSLSHSMSGFTTGGFGVGDQSRTEQMYISQFYVGTSANIGTTQISNIWTYGQPVVQGSAAMPMPKFSRDNSLNTYIVGKSPAFYFKMDEATGAPQNIGSVTVDLSITGTNFTQNISSPNYKAFNSANRDTQYSGSWSATTGTFSSANQQTILLYAKLNSGNQNALLATAAFGSVTGNGLVLQQLANGTIRFRVSNATLNEDATTTANFADGNYHMFVAVKNGSSTKLYVDGIERASNSSGTITLTDSGVLAIGGLPNLAAASASRDITIDEFAVLPTAFTAQDALEAFQKVAQIMDWTASAALPSPAVSVGYGPTIAEGAMTASASLPNVFPFIPPATGQALLQQPNFEATDLVNVTADVMTASALFEDITFDIGEYNGAQHMDATATFPQPQLLIPGFWFDSPRIANADIVQPAISTTLGALIKPQSLNAIAFFALPPAYYLITDDKWYQRLLDVDYQSAAFGGKLTFFNTSDNIYLSGSYDGWTAQANRSPLQSYYGYNLYDSPLPVASAGYFDPVNRKALNLRNIALTYADRETYSEGWTMEAMIQTTKKNQFIAAGYYLGSTSSGLSRNKRTAFRLNDGKIALTKVKDSTLGQYTSTDAIDWTGFKDIADGEWHHIILQYRDDDNRVQVWIDGELDIQRYGSTVYIPNQIGFNSNDADAYSDFKISGIAINKESFVLERETYINYLAAFGITPIEAAPATASVTFGTETKGRGNRARALMLYFWPTYNANAGYYVGSDTNPFRASGVNTSEGHDIGAEAFDYDTFYGLTTYLTDKTQTFFDWDVFPLPVKEFYSGDTYRGDKHPLLNESVIIDQGPIGTTYVDPVTDNYRYVNLMEDVYDLDQYDAIFFRNYPDQSKEQDEMGLNSKTEVDEYFNIQEKTLFAEFLNNLRTAVDTYNISLFVTNPQLAKDLGIIADATPVPLLRNQGSFYADEYSDNRAPVVTGRVAVDGTPIDGVNIHGAGWYDTWFNDRHRLINQLEYLTDDNAFIWTDYAFYQNADELEYGGPDRLYKRYENRPYGLQIDDEFVFADSGNPRFRLSYQAVKPENVLAGIPITALSKKIWNQNYAGYVQVDNPYKDYVTTIALPVGTNLNGKLTGGKIFVSFSENVGNSFTSENPQFNTSFVEYHEYDMASTYWVEIAYNAKIIDAAQRAQYLAGTAQQPPLYDENNGIKQYWSLSGDNIVSRVEPVTQSLKGFVGGDIPALLQNPLKLRSRQGLSSLNSGERLRDALGRFASGGGSSSATGGNLSTFKIVTGRTYDTGTVFIPSINTRGLWWLSDKVRLTGTVVGAPAAKATATMPQPLVEADHPNTVVAGAMIATATINETQFKSASRNIVSLPMTASAKINGVGGKNVLAGTGANATAGIVSAYAITQGAEQVIMYLHHVDPILYLRKEIIR